MRKLSKVDTLKLKIIEDISLGFLHPGDKVYSRHQFMRRYKCSRGSIDKAVAALVNEGFLFSRQGAGTFVANRENISEKIERVYLIGNFGKKNVYSQIFQTGSLAAELQKHVDCFLCDYADVNVNLENISRPGSAVIWDHPGHNQMMVMNYLRQLDRRQILVHRIFEDYEYITIDYDAGISTGLEWLKEWSDKVAFFTTHTHTSLPYIAERQLCFFETAIRKSIQVPADWFFNDIDRKDENFDKIEKYALKIFKEGKPPRAIYADYCPHAASILTAARTCGLEPGKDFRMLVFDYEEFLGKTPGIAMIKQDMNVFKDKLVYWVANPQQKMKQRLKPELVFNK
jgi:DNA-binding LacI/PurR family transcriptional regulator